MRREGESKLVSEVSSHEANSLSAYLRVVRRRKWIIIACVIVLPVTAYILSVRQPARYEASAQVYLSSEDLAGALTGISASYVDPVQLANTQAALAQVPTVARERRRLVRPQEHLAGELLGSVGVSPQSDTSILTFTVTNGDPKSPRSWPPHTRRPSRGTEVSSIPTRYGEHAPRSEGNSTS